MAKKEAAKETPLMRQYNRIKAQHPDAVLLFRVGDFYETFLGDAVIASKVLGITLTKRNNGGNADSELAGFPYHSLESYLPKLVRAGYRVAVCDQIEDPKLAKTIVERGITEVVTPGVAFSDQVVDGRSNNWLAAVCGSAERFGVVFLDVTTGEFLVGEGNAEQVDKLLAGYAPSEVLVPRHAGATLQDLVRNWRIQVVDEWAFTDDFARERLLGWFGTTGLKGYGVDDLVLGQRAAGAVLHYLGETRHDRMGHVRAMARITLDDHLHLDRFTVRNLELVAPVNEGGRTLLAAMDHCVTPMGSRLLKRWLLFPLVDRKAIEERHARVGRLVERSGLREELATPLQAMGDVERACGKAATGRINPRELLQLDRAVRAYGLLREQLLADDAALWEAVDAVPPPIALADRIAASIEPEAPVQVHKGGVLRAGVDAELDELRDVTVNGKEMLLAVQQRECERTGISSLKVGYNNVFGYYLEVRHTHRDKVPSDWVRKQTLTGAERYITDELKTLEDRILGAEERIQELESRRYQELVVAVAEQAPVLQRMAAVVAAIDVLRGFAVAAKQWAYVRPIMDDGLILQLQGGRHPVIEQQMPPGEPYVANDVLLDPAEQQALMITGPNMSGKSALLRQTALIVLMAQCGSFVPADAARIGIVDRVFTRVGASDNLSTGESTFMVEMNETASILNNLSERSLVLLDEIGRGTSTYDGISIAWAIAEYLHTHSTHPKTLFATHYHELNEMATSFPRIRNAHVAVREVDGKVLFLRKLVPGGTDRSFGIHVARMAGMPQAVVQRAQRVLAHLERSHAGVADDAPGSANDPLPVERPIRTAELAHADPQLSFFQLDDPALEGIREKLQAIDIDTLTPVEALLKLNEIKRMAGGRVQEAAKR